MPLDKDLLTHEEALKFLAGTLEALRKGDLNPSWDLVSVLEIGLGVPNAQLLLRKVLGGLLKEILRMYSVFHEVSETTKQPLL